MTDFPYGGASGGGVRQFHDDPSLHYSLTSVYPNPNSLELMFQQQIRSEQLLSPTFQHPVTMSSTSPHQAMSQPSVTAYMDSRTGNSYSQRPANTRRSVSSQRSPTLAGPYQRNGSFQRSSRSSFGNGSPPHGLQMARAASQYSNASTYQAAPQPNATQPHPGTSNFYPSTMAPSSSPTNPQYDSISATLTGDSILDYDGVSGIMGRHSAEADQESEVFGQATTSTE